MSSAGVDTEGIQGTEARVATSNDRALVWKYFPSAREGSLLERYVVNEQTYFMSSKIKVVKNRIS